MIVSGVPLRNVVVIFILSSALTAVFVHSLKATEPAKYDITFISMWTKQNHPRAYPEKDAHWSKVVLASHRGAYTMWNHGSLASESISKIATTGSVNMIKKELKNARDKYVEAEQDDENEEDLPPVPEGGGVLAYGTGKFTTNNGTKVQTIKGLIVDKNHPRVSAITKICPSPDWFTGMYGINLVDNGVWVDKLQVPVPPFDAGVDSGSNYTSSRKATIPPEKIFQLTLWSVPKDTRVFVNTVGNEAEVPPVAVFEFTRVNTTTSKK